MHRLKFAGVSLFTYKISRAKFEWSNFFVPLCTREGGLLVDEVRGQGVDPMMRG